MTEGKKEGRKEGAFIRARACNMDNTTALDIPVKCNVSV